MPKRIFAFVFVMVFALAGFAQSSAEKFTKSAETKAAMDDYAGALQDIQKAVGLSSKSPQLYYMRGMIHYMNGSKSLADEDFERVVALPAKDADTLKVKALAYNRLRNHKARDEVFQELLTLEPKTAKDYVAHSVALLTRKSYNESVSMCDAAIEKDPKYVPAYVMRGSLRNLTKEVKNDEAALEDFKKALSLDPKNPELLYLLGRLQMEMGLKEDSVETLKQCLALAPDCKRIERLLRKAETGK